jgi:5-methylcytosine-specific restriction enzyme subunit McrC
MPSDDDLKQMYIYNLFWECNRSILIYPAQNSNNNHGDYYDYRDKKALYNKCSVQTINILDEENKLNKMLGENLLKEIVSM